mgnify:CR=1 FL=1
MPTKRVRRSRERVGEPSEFEMIFEHNIWPPGVLEEMQRKGEEMHQRDLEWHAKLKDGTYKNDIANAIPAAVGDLEAA